MTGNVTSPSSYVTCFPDWRNTGFYLNKSSSRINFILVAVFYSLEGCSGSILNLSFIITVLKTKSLRTIPNIILLSLSINDLIMSLIIIPCQVYDIVLLSKGKLWCNLHIWLTRSEYSSLCVSLSLMVIISLEKYVAVCFPFLYERYVTKARVGCVIVAIAVVTTLMTFLFPISQSSAALFNVITVVVLFVGFCVFLWCQWKIFIVLSRIKRRILTEQTPSATDLHNKREKAFSLLFITLSFVLCWFLPLIYRVYSSIFGRSQVLHQYVRPWLYMVIFTSNTLSPMVYYWRLKSVRNKAWKLFFQKRSVKPINVLSRRQLMI